MRRPPGAPHIDALLDVADRVHRALVERVQAVGHGLKHLLHPVDGVLDLLEQHLAAVAGHPKAQAALAVRYQNGEGVARNPERALFWALQALRQGIGRAQDTVDAMSKELGPEAAERVRKEAGAN